MKSYIIKLSLILLSFCNSFNIVAQKINGVYKQDEMQNMKLHLSEDLFLFRDYHKYTHLAIYNCSDTLAFGYWEG